MVAKEKAAQLFTNGRGLDQVRPIKGIKQCSQALSGVIEECGIPEWLVVDNHKLQGSADTHSADWGESVKEHQIKQT